MPKEKIDAHASVLITYSLEAEKLFLSQYNAGYPKAIFRGSANLIGGNVSPNDYSPEDVLIRELSEEFNPNHGIEKKFVGEVDWASDSDIRLIRTSLFGFQPLQDFKIIQPRIGKDGEQDNYDHVFNSVFYAEIPGKTIETIERNIRDGKNITTEGNIGLFTLEELAKSEKGIYSTAWATAPILNYKFGSDIPHSKNFIIEARGIPMRNFKEYFNAFDYNEENVKLAAEAKL